MRWLIAILLIINTTTTSACAEPPTAWTSLLRPSSFDHWRDGHHGWRIVSDVSLSKDSRKQFDDKQGRGVLVSHGDASNLESRDDYQDVDVKLDFMIPKQSNSGVKLMGRYEIQIRDTYGATNLTGDSCGGIYPRAELTPKYRYLDQGVPPRVNAAKPAGEWQSLEIEFIAPRFDANGKKTSNARFARVVLNGKLIHQDVEAPTPTGHAWRLEKEVPSGPLLLQGDHGAVAFRNIQVRPHIQADSSTAGHSVHPALVQMEEDPKLPRVLLIGDSITMGYTQPLRELLAGKANVQHPTENCGPSRRILERLDRYLGKKRWDVIQFNCGIHDLTHLNEARKVTSPGQGGKPQVSLDEYRANLEQIVARLRKTGAKLIWCTTTPLHQPAAYRLSDDVERYNEMAKKVMERNAIPINDLNRQVLSFKTPMWMPDGVHFTPQGYHELAELAAPVIEATLNKRQE
jgi:lysophospholipase L1-like esterase